jgi:threonine dehydratase
MSAPHAAPPSAPSPQTVREAAEILAGSANRTLVATSRQLNERTGAAVFLTCENLQRSGSFKFRGAFHALAKLSPEERARGVVTFSSGNHAQAMALAGRLLGIAVTVVMPRDAPFAKQAATREYGAEIVLYDPDEERREMVAASIRSERGSTLVPPFDHPHIVSGQGTAALELFEETGPLDVLLAPCGGGGLLSGSALAASLFGDCRVIGVEPEVADDATRTFHTGTLQRVDNPATIADGLRTPSLGAVTWPIIRSRVADMVTVSEAGIVEAMRFLWARMKLVVEPSGAVGIAGLLANPALARGKRVGVILSGGNLDLAAACALLAPPSSGEPTPSTIRRG